jgi:hypothetical protein
MAKEKPQISADKYGFTKTEDGYKVDAKSLLASVGGVQGIVETSLPGFLYVFSFAIFHDLKISITTVAIAVVLLTIRHLLKKRPITALLGSFVGIGLAIYLTLRPEGQARDFYLPGFWQNAGYGSVLLISILLRYPVIGLLVGFMTNQGLSWRNNRRKMRFFNLVTLLWVGLFATRLAIEVPLYLVNDVVTLGFAKLVLGLPFYLTMIWVSWLLLRKVVSTADDGILDK